MDRSTQAVLVALLLHLLFLGMTRLAIVLAPVRAPEQPPILMELDPPPTDSTQAPKKLLLSQRNETSKESDAPENARYFSDRNQSVDRETRARAVPGTDISRLQSPSLRKSLQLDHSSLSDGPLVPQSTSNQRLGTFQELPDRNLSEGAENLLNTVQSVHYSFYSRMYGALAPIWQSMIRNARPDRPLLPGDYTVIATLVLDEHGNLIDIVFRERSGVPQFNDAVIASAQKVSRFPNPPRELIDSRREVRTMWSFTVNVDEHSLLRLAPPRRIN